MVNIQRLTLQELLWDLIPGLLLWSLSPHYECSKPRNNLSVIKIITGGTHRKWSCSCWWVFFFISLNSKPNETMRARGVGTNGLQEACCDRCWTLFYSHSLLFAAVALSSVLCDYSGQVGGASGHSPTFWNVNGFQKMCKIDNFFFFFCHPTG